MDLFLFVSFLLFGHIVAMGHRVKHRASKLTLSKVEANDKPTKDNKRLIGTPALLSYSRLSE